MPFKNSKFSKIREKLIKFGEDNNEIVDVVVEYELLGNISTMAKKYGEPYSNFRRFLLDEIKALGNESDFQVDYLNVEDFTWLKLGDTFQYADWLTTWKVVKIMDKESEKVFLLNPTKTRTPNRHWVCDELVTE